MAHSTPSDLARFVIGIQQSLAGKSNSVVSPAMTRRMLTVQMADDGLGVVIKGSGKTLCFLHGGRDEGFDTEMIARAETDHAYLIHADG